MLTFYGMVDGQPKKTVYVQTSEDDKATQFADQAGYWLRSSGPAITSYEKPLTAPEYDFEMAKLFGDVPVIEYPEGYDADTGQPDGHGDDVPAPPVDLPKKLVEALDKLAKTAGLTDLQDEAVRDWLAR